MNAPQPSVEPATRRIGDVRVARALRALRAGDVATLCVDEWHLSGVLEARLHDSGLEFGIECDGAGHLHYVPLGVSS